MLMIGITTSLENTKQHIPLSYPAAIYRSGALPVLLSPPLSPKAAAEYAGRLDGLLLSGGMDADPALYGQEKHPMTDGIDARRDEEEICLIHAFLDAKKPILGICRGIQMLNAALGGTLTQHVPELPGVAFDHGNSETRHPVFFEPDSFLYTVYGPSVITNSTHHQAVLDPAPGFRITGRSSDGVPEAIENDLAIGVQFHPERLFDEGHAPLFAAFLRLCAAAR